MNPATLAPLPRQTTHHQSHTLLALCAVVYISKMMWSDSISLKEPLSKHTSIMSSLSNKATSLNKRGISIQATTMNYTVSHTAVVMLSRDCHIPIRNTFATCTLYTPYYPTSSPNAKSTPLVVQNWISSMVSATFYATLSPKSYSSSFLAAP